MLTVTRRRFAVGFGWTRVPAAIMALTLASSASQGQSALERALPRKADRTETKTNVTVQLDARAISIGTRSLAGAQRIKVLPEQVAVQGGDRMGPAPANDDCADAQLISGTGQFAFDNTNATMDGPPHFACNFFGNSDIDKDLWYLWEAPVTTEYRLSTCGLAFFDTKIALYSPGCPVSDLTILDCDDDSCGSQSQIFFNATAGEQFLFRIGVFPGAGGGQGSFNIEIRPGQDICGLPAGNCQAPNNAEGFDASAFFIWDDFRTTTSDAVSSVCFAGAFFDGFGDCQPGTEPVVTVAYYQDIAGTPNFTPIAEFSSITNLTLNGPAPTGDLIDNQFPVYRFTADHDPVPLNGSTCYWIRITVDTQLMDCNFFWRGGLGGNTISFQSLNDTPFPDDLLNADLDFCLDIPLGDVTVCQTAEIPSNDECDSPESLFPGARLGFQNLFATTNPDDPPFSCRTFGPGLGFGSLWYSFQPVDDTAQLSLCGSMTGDTLMAVYEGSCESLNEIACNDDFCGFRSQLTLEGLTPGQTYLVQIAGFDQIDQDFYELRYDSPAPSPPPEDLCSGAIELFVSPGGQDAAIRETELATIDLDAPACGFSVISAPGIWFKVQGTGEGMTAALCNSEAFFDTKMNVYCGSSCDELVCVANDDDSCDNQAEISWCSDAGQTYFILVFGFDGQVGVANILVTSDGMACGSVPDCATCAIPCPPGAVPEAEACGLQLNDGCNISPAAFEPIQCGDTVCGIAAGVSNTRDTDWYTFTLAERSLVRCMVDAELPVEVFYLSDTCDPPPVPFAGMVVERCGSGLLEAILDPGTYRLFIANVLDAYPCDTSNVYVAQFDCAPVGACCEQADCTSTSPSGCSGLAGLYQGDATECPITYQMQPGQTEFEDISQSGAIVELGNDQTELVTLPFTVKLYGVTRTQIGVSSDGFISFVGGEIDPNNQPIPTSSGPNGFVAGLWTDLDPSAGGMVQTETLGAFPDRRFIVQWTNVPRALFGGSNTFQTVLFENSGCIELRYDLIDVEPAPGAYTIGIESFAGDAGLAIDGQSVNPGDLIELCPVFDGGACASPCFGDADRNNTVNFADITSVLLNWLESGPHGDADFNGTVNFADITSVLNNWLDTCP